LALVYVLDQIENNIIKYIYMKNTFTILVHKQNSGRKCLYVLNQMTETYVPYVSSIGTWPLNTVCIDAL